MVLRNRLVTRGCIASNTTQVCIVSYWVTEGCIVSQKGCEKSLVSLRPQPSCSSSHSPHALPVYQLFSSSCSSYVYTYTWTENLIFSSTDISSVILLAVFSSLSRVRGCHIWSSRLIPQLWRPKQSTKETYEIRWQQYRLYTPDFKVCIFLFKRDLADSPVAAASCWHSYWPRINSPAARCQIATG